MALEDFGVRLVAYGYKDALILEARLLPRLEVLNAGPGYLRVAEDLVDHGVPDEINFRVLQGSILQYLASPEFFPSVDHSHTSHNVSEKRSLFHCCVPPANDDDIFFFEEESVACCTAGHSLSSKSRL